MNQQSSVTAVEYLCRDLNHRPRNKRFNHCSLTFENTFVAPAAFQLLQACRETSELPLLLSTHKQEDLEHHSSSSTSPPPPSVPKLPEENRNHLIFITDEPQFSVFTIDEEIQTDFKIHKNINKHTDNKTRHCARYFWRNCSAVFRHCNPTKDISRCLIFLNIIIFIDLN